MARQRNGATTTAAVLNIVFGAIFALCCGANGILQQASGGMGSAFGQPESGFTRDFREEIATELPSSAAIGMASASLLLLLGIVLIVLGVGLLKMQDWARRGTIICCLVLVLYAVASAAYSAAVVAPASERALDRAAERNPKDPAVQTASFIKAVVVVSPWIGAAIYCAFAAVVLLLMFIRGTREAFAGRPESGERLDEGWGDVERRDDQARDRNDDRGEGGIRAPERW